MKITHKVKMDLALHSCPTITMVQGDTCTRRIKIALSCNGTPWAVPEGASVLVRYKKPNLKCGVYDTLPDGTAAGTVSGNCVTVAVAPDVLTVPGEAELVVTLVLMERQCSTFNLRLTIQPNHTSGQPSQEGSYVSAFLPVPEHAAVGQYLVVDGVNSNGVVIKTAAVDAPEGSGTGADSIPAYVRDEAERLAAVVQSHQNERTFSFIAVADTHHSLVTNPTQMAQTLKHCSQALAIIRQRVHIDFAAMLGDMIWDNGETPEQAMEAMRTVNGALHDAFLGIPNFRTRGNHDGLSGGTDTLTDTQIFANIGSFNAGAVFNDADRLGGYCYRDFEDFKTRVICVNNTETIDGGYGIGSAQLAWLPGALDLSEKGDDWKSILLAHCPMDEWGNTSEYMRILENAEGLLCTFHGHLHNYLSGGLGTTRIPRICIPNACFYRNNEKSGTKYAEETTYGKVAGTKDDTAFCVVTVDPVSGIVYADHYGAGYDRIIACGASATMYSVRYSLTYVSSSSTAAMATGGETYETVLRPYRGYTLDKVTVTMGGTDITDQVYSSGTVTIPNVTGPITIAATAAVQDSEKEEGYTNVLPLATSTWGGTEIYNSIGYKTGTRLNSSVQEVSANNMCLSGIIPVAVGDVVRIKNITVSGSNTSYLGTFNVEGLAGVTDISILGTPDSNGVYTWTNGNTWTAFRLSVGVIDDTTIITINEEIV